jgi:hypothetical protein
MTQNHYTQRANERNLLKWKHIHSCQQKTEICEYGKGSSDLRPAVICCNCPGHPRSPTPAREQTPLSCGHSGSDLTICLFLGCLIRHSRAILPCVVYYLRKIRLHNSCIQCHCSQLCRTAISAKNMV